MVGKQYFSSELNKDQPLLAVSRWQELVLLTYLPIFTLMENVSVIMSSTKLSIVCRRQNKN